MVFYGLVFKSEIHKPFRRQIIRSLLNDASDVTDIHLEVPQHCTEVRPCNGQWRITAYWAPSRAQLKPNTDKMKQFKSINNCHLLSTLTGRLHQPTSKLNWRSNAPFFTSWNNVEHDSHTGNAAVNQFNHWLNFDVGWCNRSENLRRLLM